MSKYKLAVCEIYNPIIHGIDYASDPNISNHFLIETLFDSEDFFDEIGLWQKKLYTQGFILSRQRRIFSRSDDLT